LVSFVSIYKPLSFFLSFFLPSFFLSLGEINKTAQSDHRSYLRFSLHLPVSALGRLLKVILRDGDADATRGRQERRRRQVPTLRGKRSQNKVGDDRRESLLHAPVMVKKTESTTFVGRE